MKQHPLFKVLFAIVLATIVGLWVGPQATIFGVPYVRIFDLIGKLFLNALTLVVVPLVASSIISGIARLGQDGNFGKVGVQTLAYFALTVALAVSVGLVIAVFLKPGASQTGIPLLKEAAEVPLSLNATAPTTPFDQIEKLLYRLVPSNILAVAASGQMLGLIFFTFLFGYFASQIETGLSHVVVNFWKGVFEIMMRITHLVMKALPIGVFGLMAKVAATTGLDSLRPVLYFFVCVLLGLVIFGFILLPLLLKFWGGISPRAHFRAMTPALLTAFSTSSSAATLPITIECMEKNAGVPNRLCSFILPLGTTLNLTGTAIYVVMSVLFILQISGVELTAANLLVIGVMSFFSGFGMIAGVPSGCLVGIIIVLQTLGYSAEGVVLILATDRILDMCRTAITVFGNSCCLALVAKSK